MGLLSQITTNNMDSGADSAAAARQDLLLGTQHLNKVIGATDPTQGIDVVGYMPPGTNAEGGRTFGNHYHMNSPVFVWGFLTDAHKTQLEATLTSGAYTAANLQYAIDRAIAHAKVVKRPWLHLPPGNLTIDCLPVEDVGLFQAFRISGCGNSTRLRGAGRAGDANKSVLRIAPSTVGFVQFGAYSDFVIDTSILTDATSNAGIYMAKAYNMTFDRVHVLATGAAKRTLLCNAGVYTTVFHGCDLGSTSGIVELTGISLGDAVTTVNFVGQTAFASLRLNQCVNITCASAVVQGDLQKFHVRNTLGFTVRDCDIEGQIPTQTILGQPTKVLIDTHAAVEGLQVQGNAYNGISGTWTLLTPDPANLPLRYSVDEYLNDGQQMRNPNGCLYQASIREAYRYNSDSNAGNRFRVNATHPSSGDADVQVSTGPTNNAYFGITRGGISYIDARGSAGFGFYVSGTVKQGVDASDRRIMETLTAAAANAGTNGALPAQVAGYEVVIRGGTRYGVPFYPLP